MLDALGLLVSGLLDWWMTWWARIRSPSLPTNRKK